MTLELSSSSWLCLLLLLVLGQQQHYIRSTQAFCPVVICPGFGNDSIDYDTPLEQPSEVGLKSVLARRGFDIDQIYTVPVKRTDWIRVAGGLLDMDFYFGTAKPTGLGYGWYLKRLKETVDLAYNEQQQQQQDGKTQRKEKVLLIGHSAGGWLARAAMADGTWFCSDENDDDDDTSESSSSNNNNNIVRTSDRIRCLVTLGAIHKVPNDKSKCVTRGALQYTDENYPGAFLKDEGIGYVSIGGAAIVGDDTNKEKDGSSDDTSSAADDLYKNRGEGNSKRVAFTSYESVAGVGDLIGDGVVPLDWTQLEGSQQVILPDVLHSINEAGTTLPTDRWYGSEKVIDRWLPTVMKEANLSKQQSSFFGKDAIDGLQQWVSSNLFQNDS